MSPFFYLFIYLLSLISFANHPLLLSLLLVMSAVVVSLALFTYKSLWMMYSIMLIFLGGMMVIFIYVSILNNEQKFFLGSPNLTYSSAFIMMVLAIVNLSNPLKETYTFLSMDLSDLYKFSMIYIFMFLVSYLLLSLFTTVKFSESFKGTIMKLK